MKKHETSTNENNIETLLESALDAVVGLDHEGLIVYWNLQAEVTFGWTRAEVLGRRISETILPEVHVQDIERGPLFGSRHEVTGIRKDGTQIPIEVSITPVKTGHSQVYYGFLRDISDRHQALSDLKAAKEAAEAANDAKTAFLANMSHEIRTPLGVILGFSELIADPLTSNAEKASYIEAIKRNGDLLSSIINDILDLSKVEADRVVVEPRETYLADLIDDITSTLALAAAQKGVLLSTHSDSSTPKMIRTDPTRIRQILLNIIGNAIKFTEQGRVDIYLKMIPSKDKGSLLSFVIQDTGVGIAPKDVDKLFRPFSQADGSSTRQFGGVGLGLALSKRLARLLGGDLILTKSEVGKGSTFSVTIDPGCGKDFRSLQTDLAAGISPKMGSIRLDGLRVLLAEDSHDNQILVSRLLKMAGARVDTAENGKIALEKARRENYDVLLMDIQMPIMDGYATVAELRKNGYKTPIIALTAHAMNEERLRSLSSGFDEHISKPVDRNLLLESIAHFCGRTA